MAKMRITIVAEVTLYPEHYPELENPTPQEMVDSEQQMLRGGEMDAFELASIDPNHIVEFEVAL